MSPGQWIRRLALPLLAASLAAAAAGPVQAGYQGTVASNESAFEPPCLSFDDPYPEKMMKAAAAALGALGYDSRSYSGAAFTRASYLARTANDWGTYVHSHGDHYWNAADGRRYAGFREDSGDCSQSVVYSKDIAARRAGRATNLVVMSTCHLGEDTSTMPGAFGIAKKKYGAGSWGGPVVLRRLPRRRVGQRRVDVRGRVLELDRPRVRRGRGVRCRLAPGVRPRLRCQLVGLVRLHRTRGTAAVRLPPVPVR